MCYIFTPLHSKISYSENVSNYRVNAGVFLQFNRLTTYLASCGFSRQYRATQTLFVMIIVPYYKNLVEFTVCEQHWIKHNTDSLEEHV